MKLKKFKERNNKQIGIILFTITCILLVSGVILYRTFAIFEVKTNQNIMNGQVEKPGDIQFMVYVEDKLTKEVPKKELGYTLDTSKSKCENGSLITWNDIKWSIEIKNISTTRTKCFLYFDKIYVENELNGAIPNLENGRLIPVIFKENGKVLKADITDTEDPWYKYADQKWANAVILRDGKTDEYIPGDEILESDIKSYFVWIPRYKYQLKKSEEEWNKNVNGIEKGSYGNVESFYQAIDGNKGATEVFNIEFETKDKGNTQGGKQGEYLTHPAFLSFDSNGFWVGKFETGYNQNSDDKNVTPTSDWSFAGAEINEENSAKVIIKPNVYSWRNIQVANAFYTSYNYKRDLESHMMKNMEWGAVAYLTQSKYGRCINNSCTRVRINNDSYHRTGYSAVKDPTCGYTETNEVCNQYGISGDIVNSYDNLASVASSTTNNYYGVFDMSGGAWETPFFANHQKTPVKC